MVCDTFTCGDTKNCKKCYAAATVPALARSLGRTIVQERKALPVCKYEGPVLERCNLCGEHGELNHVRDCEVFERCTRGPNNGTIASCQTCPEYKTKTSAIDPWRPENQVSIPLPPKWDKPVTSHRALVTAGIGFEHRGLLNLTRALMEAYATRVGADFVEITWNPAPQYGFASKWMLYTLLEVYEHIVFVDSDVVLRPRCINLFKLPSSHFWYYDDLSDMLRTGPHLIEEYQRVRISQDMPRLDRVKTMPNSGVLIASQEHREIFLPPIAPLPPLYCAEQHMIAARMHDLQLSRKILTETLSPDCNYQWWVHHLGLSKPDWAPPEDAILHFSGVGDREKRLRLIKEAING